MAWLPRFITARDNCARVELNLEYHYYHLISTIRGLSSSLSIYISKKIKRRRLLYIQRTGLVSGTLKKEELFWKCNDIAKRVNQDNKRWWAWWGNCPFKPISLIVPPLEWQSKVKHRGAFLTENAMSTIEGNW